MVHWRLAFFQPHGRQRNLLLHLQQSRPRIQNNSKFSVVIRTKDPHDKYSKVRLGVLGIPRAMSVAPHNNSKQQKRKLEVALDSRKKVKAMYQMINVPNVITVARILATPYLAFTIIEGEYGLALGPVAGVSDWLDGFIARAFHQESIVGSFLDPFADKLLIGSLSLSMMWTGLLPTPLATLILGRDFMLMSGTFYFRLKTKNQSSAFFDTSDSVTFQVKPSMLSKINTALQLSVCGLALTKEAWQLPPEPILNLLFGVVGTTTFLSGFEYLYGYLTMTGALKPISRVDFRNVVERTEAVVKRTEEVVKSPLRKAVQRTKGRLRR
ncbi:putative CDP-alcohol phosphatidyltransferase [Plasmopara halstedii]